MNDDDEEVGGGLGVVDLDPDPDAVDEAQGVALAPPPVLLLLLVLAIPGTRFRLIAVGAVAAKAGNRSLAGAARIGVEERAARSTADQMAGLC